MSKKFTCVCGDAHLYFKYRKKPYREKEVKEIFEQRISSLKSEVFPGLILRDSSGQHYVPRLVVVLDPVEVDYTEVADVQATNSDQG